MEAKVMFLFPQSMGEYMTLSIAVPSLHREAHHTRVTSKATWKALWWNPILKMIEWSDPLRKNLFSSWTCLDLNTLLVWLPATVCTRSKKQDDNEVGVTFHTTCARTNIIHLNVLSASTRDRGFCTTRPKLLSTHWSASLHFNFSESVFWNIWKIRLQTSVTAEFL